MVGINTRTKVKFSREYQRRLWDPDCTLGLVPTDDSSTVAEWHSHVYDRVGFFLFDLRGNRIDRAGTQMSDNPLLSDEQWADLEEFFASETMRVAVLVSETPFLGDEPAVCKEKVLHLFAIFETSF